jgi:DnaJ-class molecular chaperone
MQDPYRVLGVAPDADPLTIRRAYQKLARRWHPALRAADREAEARFQEASQAYAVLSDPEQRRHWDQGLRRTVETRRSVRARRRGTLSTPSLAYRFEELVVELLPEEAADLRTDAAASADVHSEVELDLAEAIHGVVVSLSVQRESVCGACDGRGRGCAQCDGRGIQVDLERVRVRIPPGAGDGSRVRVRGQGSRLDGERGDLYVTLRVRPHPVFARQGDDIHGEVPVTVAEAALGAAIRVPTVHGPVSVQLPAGTRSGQRFRLAGRGVSRPGSPPGDHFYRVEIVPPSGDRGENRRLLDELEQDDPRAGLPTEAL